MEKAMKKLKKEIIKILKSYLNNQNDSELKKQAEELYLSYLNADALLPREISEAKNLLVDIAYDTGTKPDKDQIEKLLIKLKKNMKKLKLFGLGNEGERSYFILSKEQSFLSLFPKFLLGCGIDDFYTFEENKKIKDYVNIIQHFQNNKYNIDVIYTQDRIFLTVRTDEKNRENLMKGIQNMTEMD